MCKSKEAYFQVNVITVTQWGNIIFQASSATKTLLRLIGKDFIGGGGRPPGSPTVMGSYGVSIIINAAHNIAG